MVLLVLAGFGCFWLVLVDFGWFWLVLVVFVGFVLFWLVLDGFVSFGWFGMVWYDRQRLCNECWQRLCNECWKRLCNPQQSVSQSVTKVGIELLGQLKKSPLERYLLTCF